MLVRFSPEYQVNFSLPIFNLAMLIQCLFTDTISLSSTDVSADGTVLTFSPPLKYEHVGITQTIEGVTLDMRAEVGLLTRNVKVRGSVQEEWVEEYEACPEEFDTGEERGRVCFLGFFPGHF